jgi:hypothetical protein
MDESVDFIPYLRRIVELVPKERRDALHAILGEMLANCPGAVWYLIFRSPDLPPEMSTPETPTGGEWLSRHNDSTHEALGRFIETMDRPIHPYPEHETAAERRVRILENILERIKLAQQSGMDIELKCKLRMYWFRRDVERDLITARAEALAPDFTQRQ